MGLSARRLVLVALLVVVLAGCRIDVVLRQHDPLPGGVEWDADDVEMLPNGEFVAGGCLFTLGGPGLGVVVFGPDATVLRVLSRCSSIEDGSLGVAATADGTIYFVRSREIVPFEEYRYELVRVPPGGSASDGVVVHSDTSPDRFGAPRPFFAPAVSPDGSIVLVRSADPDKPGIYTVTDRGTRRLRPGTDGLSPQDGYEVRNDGTIVTLEGNTVVSITRRGTKTVLAGTGQAGFSGDGGPATQATFNDPSDVAQGPAGVIHVADFGNDRIRRIAPDGIIRTVAGGGTEDPDAGGLAIRAQLDGPWRIAYDGTQPGAGDELWLLDEPFVDGDLLYLGIR
jgi:hypothetical protein